jgi:hypothetical protein
MLSYDPSLLALNRPELRDTVFAPSTTCGDEQLCCELSRLAYVRFEEAAAAHQRLADALARVGFEAPQGFTDAGTDTQAFGAVRPSDGRIVVAFRGTQPDKIKDLLIDAEALVTPWAGGAASVHAGFARAFNSVRPAIEAWLAPGGIRRPGRLMLTGHSLGAALATLGASAWRPDLLCTFGSPRVGDRNFVSGLAGIRIIRFRDCCDLVTCVPPALGRYDHAGALRYIDRHGTIHGEATEAFIEMDCLAARAEYAMSAAFVPGNVPERGLADHAMANYLRALW